MPIVQVFLRALMAFSVPPSCSDFGMAWAPAGEAVSPCARMKVEAARAAITICRICVPPGLFTALYDGFIYSLYHQTPCLTIGRNCGDRVPKWHRRKANHGCILIVDLRAER